MSQKYFHNEDDDEKKRKNRKRRWNYHHWFFFFRNLPHFLVIFSIFIFHFFFFDFLTSHIWFIDGVLFCFVLWINIFLRLKEKIFNQLFEIYTLNVYCGCRRCQRLSKPIIRKFLGKAKSFCKPKMFTWLLPKAKGFFPSIQRFNLSKQKK